ncbi:sugar kinase [Pseudarthrobacter raffinosi]|uniref:sugar kinase n=1 Tax=Pseudarthrobacter raffinosi TaxID=2953651 RepID=UPI00208FF99A|nr:sugar kinase [Pseudarthrobacter sp. MDT3-9]MCO4253263.1 sugar kinase [Pseudarthrobacter sp. MDT3-9]
MQYDKSRGIACLGEAMVVLWAGDDSVPGSLSRAVGGAEANVAANLACLGLDARFISRLGDDEFGRYILGQLTSQGVNTRATILDGARQTGLYIKERTGAKSRMRYYRAGSAASAMSPSLLDEPPIAAALSDIGLLHLTGITPALSGTTAELCRRLSSRSLRSFRLSFDLNWRPTLWNDEKKRARIALAPLIRASDTVFMGSDEALALFDTGDPEELRSMFPEPDELVIKDDAHAVTVYTRGGPVTIPALTVNVIEPIGAGDAFAAGYIAGRTQGRSVRHSARLGHLMAAHVLGQPADQMAAPPPDIEEKLVLSDEDWASVVVGSPLAHQGPTTGP